MRRASLLAVPVLVALIGSIAAAAPDQPEARATAVPVRIVQPGAPEQIPLSVTAPPTAEQVLPGYAYPEDGSIVKIGSADAQVVAQPGTSSSAQANTGALAVSLFAGEITVTSLDVRASVAAGSVSASGNVSASSITGLTVLGQLITPAPNLVVPLADWGTLEVLGSQVETTQKPPRSAKASVTALRVKLIVDHGGLAAGSVIEIGVGLDERHGRADNAIAPAKPTAPTPPTPSARPVIPPDAPREPGTSIPGGAPAELIRPAPAVTAQLTIGRLRLPRLRPRLVRRHVRRSPRGRQRRLAPR